MMSSVRTRVLQSKVRPLLRTKAICAVTSKLGTSGTRRWIPFGRLSLTALRRISGGSNLRSLRPEAYRTTSGSSFPSLKLPPLLEPPATGHCVEVRRPPPRPTDDEAARRVFWPPPPLPAFGILAATFRDLLSVAPEVGVDGERAQDVVGTAHQQSPEHLVTLPGHSLLRILLAGLVDGRRQSQVGSHRAALGKPPRIFQGQDERQSRQSSHSRHLPQKSRLWVMFRGQLLYAPVIVLDLLGERADGLYHGFEGLGKLGG